MTWNVPKSGVKVYLVPVLGSLPSSACLTPPHPIRADAPTHRSVTPRRTQAADMDTMAVDVEDCVVCAEPLLWVGIGQACAGKHQAQVCSACTMRLRLVLGDKKCCICQKECQAAFVVDHRDERLTRQDLIQWEKLDQHVKEGRVWKDKQTNVYFSDHEHFKATQRISKPVCLICNQNKTFQHKNQLEAHLKKEHKKFFCELCLEGRQCFLGEQKLYTAQELRRHIDRGEPLIDHVDGAKGFKGHPCCKFCSQHFYGEGEIYFHMERSHEHCFLCRQDNPREYTYYKDYPHLEKHFVEKHHVCTHMECREQKFVVFRTADELKRHKAVKHPESMSKAEKKKAMQLQPCFTTTEKKPARVHSVRSESRTAELVNEIALTSQENFSQHRSTGAWASAAGGSTSMGNLRSNEEFPSLSKRKGKNSEMKPSWVGTTSSKKSQSELISPKKTSGGQLPWQANAPSSKPPPGFSSSRMKTVGSVKSLATASWPQIDGGESADARETSNNLPDKNDDHDIRRANKVLVQNIKERLGYECFASFRDATAAFQRNEVDGGAYMSLIDNLGLGSIVSEIAGLCPDPTKKDELLRLAALQRRGRTAHNKQQSELASIAPTPADNPIRSLSEANCSSSAVLSQDSRGKNHNDHLRSQPTSAQENQSKAPNSADSCYGIESKASCGSEGEEDPGIASRDIQKKEKPRRRKKELSSRPVAQEEGSTTQFLEKANELTRQRRNGKSLIPRVD